MVAAWGAVKKCMFHVLDRFGGSPPPPIHLYNAVALGHLLIQPQRPTKADLPITTVPQSKYI